MTTAASLVGAQVEAHYRRNLSDVGQKWAKLAPPPLPPPLVSFLRLLVTFSSLALNELFVLFTLLLLFWFRFLMYFQNTYSRLLLLFWFKILIYFEKYYCSVFVIFFIFKMFLSLFGGDKMSPRNQVAAFIFSISKGKCVFALNLDLLHLCSTFISTFKVITTPANNYTMTVKQ